MTVKFDPIVLEVIKNAFDTIADEMALILMRTAHSPIVRDSMDFSTAICDAEGRSLAQGVTTPMHLGSFYDAMTFLIKTFKGDLNPGDIFIGNDPYAAAGQHLPDVYIIKPIFIETALVGWVTTIAHQADIGGIVPGSNALGAEEIYQEGLRLPFLKLFEAGKRNDAIWEIIALNVRVPDMVHGDLSAQLSACTTGEREYLALIQRYGMQVVNFYIEELHDYAERLTRLEISELPDGTYHFVDHIDGLGEHPEPVIFSLALTIAGDTVTADWAGTSAQVRGGINTPLPFTKAGVYTAMRSIMQSDIPNCHGFTRPFNVTAPLGTVVNSVQPAPTGARGITGYRVIDCMFGALAQVVPDRVTADGTGGSTLPSFGGYTEDGKPYVFAETFMGTWGASSQHDGQEGVPHMGANQANVPIEMIEANYPLRILRYGLEPDSAGPGKFRGGNALVRDYEVLTDDCVFGVRSDKRDFPPHGLAGGSDGQPSASILIQDGKRTTLPAMVTNPIRLRKGDRFLHVTPSGGGYGPAWERQVEKVLFDIREETLSIDSAKSQYGVVAERQGDDLVVNEPQTEERRQAMRAAAI
jgi:N-methylhydantoinase B